MPVKTAPGPLRFLALTVAPCKTSLRSMASFDDSVKTPIFGQRDDGAPWRAGLYSPGYIIKTTLINRLLSSFPAHRGEINREFILTVNPEEFVYPFLIISGNCTSSRIYCFTGKIKILADMPGINSNDLMRGNSIAPFHSIWDGCPDKGNGCFFRILLTKNGLNYLSIQVLLSKFKQELMLKGKVTVYPLIHSPYIQNTEICFKCMAAAG